MPNFQALPPADEPLNLSLRRYWESVLQTRIAGGSRHPSASVAIRVSSWIVAFCNLILLLVDAKCWDLMQLGSDYNYQKTYCCYFAITDPAKTF